MTKTVVQEEKKAGAYDAYLETAKGRQQGEPAWLTTRRAAAAELVRAHGLPHPKLEGFRTTNLGAIRSEAWPTPDTPGGVTEADIAPYRLKDAAAELVLVDGLPVPGLSRLDATGITFTTLSEALASDPKALETHLAQVVAHTGPEETLRALNTAAFLDGAYLHVPKGKVVEAPIHVLHVTSARDAPAGVHPRVLAVLEETAQAFLVETYAGLGDQTWTNGVTELVLQQGVVLDHVKLQRDPPTVHHTMAAGATVGRDAKLRDLSFAVGARISRTDLIARVATGAEAQLNGLFLGRGEQLVDHHTWVDHAEPHGVSLERYKGILDGHAHGVFTGNVLVRQDAQKINSEQENRNLILSDKALIDTTPQLEIHADDVKCAHGSTIGRLPDKQIFYLRSRGFTEEQAKRVLTEAFAAEVLESVPEGPVRTRLVDLVSEWFDQRKEEA